MYGFAEPKLEDWNLVLAIMAAAIRCGASFLLTGDTRDFGPFMDKPELTDGVRILTVKAFIDYMLSHPEN